GEAVAFRLRGNVALAEKRACHRLLPGDRGAEVALDPLGEVPGLALDLALLLHAQCELDAWQQHGLGAHQGRDVGGDDLRRIEVFRVRPEANARAALLRADTAQLFQRLLDLAVVGENDPVLRAVALDVDLEALGQRIAHADADAMQAAGDAVRRIL